MNEIYRLFLEEKEFKSHRFEQIMNATSQEFALYLISPCEEDRWLAGIRLKQLNTPII
jgi:hypothetical protein